MSNELSIDDWDIPPEVMPPAPDYEVIYLLPQLRDSDQNPAYRPESLFLVKKAEANGVDLDYALPAEERRFVDHFSAESLAIEIWLALSGPITDVFLFGLGYAINSLLDRRGASSEEVQEAPLKLRIAQLDPSSGKAKGIKMEGKVADVIQAVQALKGDR